jgi:Ca2+-binding EF-hand superfamily protein
MFKVFDKEGTGNISPEVFHDIAKSLGIHLTATEAAALFGRYDANADEEITFYEFLDHFLGEQGKNLSYY